MKPKKNNKLILFISPHYKKCGETYIFKNLTDELNSKKSQLDFKIFNYYDEFNHIDSCFLIQNKFKFKLYFPFIEQHFPWLYYRIWMICVLIHLIFTFPFIIRDLQKKYEKIYLISRMATISFAFLNLFYLKCTSVSFNISIAGYVKKGFIRKFIWRILYNKLDNIIVPTADMRNDLYYLTNNTKIFEIPNPVISKDLIYFSKKNNFKNTYSNLLKIVFVGRLTKQKGIDIFIKNLDLNDNFHLDIYGSGEDFSTIKNLIEINNLSKKISLKGEIKKPWEIYKNYDLFIMPSRWEGPGHTVLEAMAVGIPVLVSNCLFGPIYNIQYGRLGSYFELKKPNSLKKIINSYINNYEYHLSKTHLAQKYVLENWNVSHSLDLYTNLFNEN